MIASAADVDMIVQGNWMTCRHASMLLKSVMGERKVIRTSPTVGPRLNPVLITLSR